MQYEDFEITNQFQIFLMFLKMYYNINKILYILILIKCK